MGKNSKKGGADKADPRFASAGYDPRFIVPSTKRNKVKVDDRFSKEEMKKLNATATGNKAKVDRFGRKVKGDESSEFEKYFEEEKEELEESEKSEESESESEDESDEPKTTKDIKGDKSDDESEEESEDDSESSTTLPAKAARKVEEESADESDDGAFLDRARGEGLQSDSDLDDSSSDDSDAEDSEVEIEEEKPAEGDPSSAFAVVNLDWDNVRAVDLMSTFASFMPKGGSIKSVTIYPSDFGKEQMQKEEIEGPPKELFRSKKKAVESDSDSDDDLDLTNKEDLEKAARKLYEEDDAEQDYDSKALRRYQLQRLRYYYAVVKCDSVATAKNIYDNCDGSEFESTANIFDLRYVPEGMDFADDEAKEKCTKIPSSYRPDSGFVTDALQHSKVKLTWDETPKERLALSTRLFSQKEIDDMDFKAYLASDTDGESEKEDLLKDKYKSLLGGKFSHDNGKEEEEDVDMEITFNPGLGDGAQAKAAEADEAKEETTIEAYKRKEKERRQKRMEKFQAAQEDVAPPSDKKKNSKKSKRPTAEDEKMKAELELLMLEEEDGAKHFSMRDVVKAEKNKKKKKGKKNFDEELVQDKFLADFTDDRFKEVFENHEFAIDPTSSEFKKTDTMKKILSERNKRLRGNEEKKKKSKRVKSQGSAQDTSALSSLVAKLKQKQ